jgi:hypothetical protein
VTEWDRRELCPDGACVGVIGADGLCKVCGRAAQNWGDERRRGLKEDPEDEADDEADDDLDHGDEGDDGDGDDGDEYEDEDDDEDDDDEEDADDRAHASAPAPSGDWAQRKLCPDGACIGVIGANGKCTVCGRAP